MMSSIFEACNSYCNEGRSETNFGDIPVVIGAGDCLQLPAVKDSALYSEFGAASSDQ